jgi:dihydrodipicolinate synthase/N-acetylneuraminate lyase
VTGPFAGIFTPLITPVTDDERLDTESLAQLVRFQIAAGVNGLCGMGTKVPYGGIDGIVE